MAQPGNLHTTTFPRGEAVTFDLEAFDEAIRSQGVSYIHWRAMRCPAGISDLTDNYRRPHPDHEGCSNGFMYRKAGRVTCLATGNSKDPQIVDAGVIEGSQVQVTLPRFYDDNKKPVYVAPYDRMFLDDPRIVVPNWQLFQTNITGRDKLNFPVSFVEHLIDNQLQEYVEGTDFQVIGGRVHWLPGGRQPGIDPETGKGRVCTVWYLYQPYWYIKSLGHEVRVTQAEDIYGDRQIQRMPHSVTLQRENVFEKEDRDPDARNVDFSRQVAEPDRGSFSEE